MADSCLAGLCDAGCSDEEIAQAKRLYDAGRYDELRRYLRLCRCELMEQLHEQQRCVDCLDYVIRHIEE